MTFKDLKRRFAALMLLSIALSAAVFSFYSYKLLADFRMNEINFILSAVESGPVEFAKLHSAELTQLRLDSLMSSPGLKQTAVRSVQIVSGLYGADLFAAWKANKQTSDKCLSTVTRSLEVESAIYPLIVRLAYDDCFVSQIAVENLWVLSAIALLLVGLLFFGFSSSVSPLLDSLKAAHSLLSSPQSEQRSADLSLIKFIPARELAAKALESIQLQKFEAIAATTQNLAHDVRKPFSMLKMVLEAVSEAKDSHASQEIAKASLPEVNQAMASVEGLIQDVMQIGSSAKPNQEVASPEALLDAAMNELFRIFPLADVSIEYDLKHRHALFVDTLRVGRVLSNILVNAVQAMNSKGHLWIKIKEENGFAEFRIGNIGSCIPKESLPNLFDAFFTSGKKGGTGLGLAIAQKVVNEHGGTICCESSQTKQYPVGYVEFVFTLPLAAELNVSRSEDLPTHSSMIQDKLLKFGFGNEETDCPNESGFDGDLVLELEQLLSKKLKTFSGAIPPLLIVDDEAVYRNSLAGLLTNFRGGSSPVAQIPVLFAKNAQEALEEALQVAKERKPFLVIQDIDLGLNSKSGIEVIKDLRKEGFKGRICVHSNRFLFEDQKTAHEAGADSVLPKPMSRAHLFKLILSSLHEEDINESTSVALSQVEKKPRIAYVDDSLTFTLSWKFKLKDKVDLETFTATDAFFQRCEAEPDFLQSFDVIVTDYYFSDADLLNGKSFAAELRQRGFSKPIYLASDGDFESEDLRPHLNGVVGKDVPSFETITGWIGGV